VDHPRSEQFELIIISSENRLSLCRWAFQVTGRRIEKSGISVKKNMKVCLQACFYAAAAAIKQRFSILGSSNRIQDSFKRFPDVGFAVRSFKKEHVSLSPGVLWWASQPQSSRAVKSWVRAIELRILFERVPDAGLTARLQRKRMLNNSSVRIEEGYANCSK
jgi:hypothetical protein